MTTDARIVPQKAHRLPLVVQQTKAKLSRHSAAAHSAAIRPILPFEAPIDGATT